MTDMQQALTVSGLIFGIVMMSQYGRREYNWHRVLLPLSSTATVGYFYLKGMPIQAVDWVVYGVGALVGLAFGLVASATTGLDRDATDGRTYTRCGTWFLTTWLAAVALRIGFVYAAEHNTWFHQHLGGFLTEHDIITDAIAPFFVIMALAMVLTRVVLIGLRVSGASPARISR